MHDTSSSSQNSSSSSLCSMQGHVNNKTGRNNVQPRSEQDFGDKTLMTGTLDYQDESNPHFVNQYAVLGRIGKGQHGEVFKCVLAPEYTFCVAIKACKRNNPRETKMSQLRQNNHAIPRSKNGKSNLADKVENAERKVKREIAIMKKCHHGQIVRLYEVIDDRFFSKILMVMEFMGGGEVKWRDTNNKPVLRVDQCRRICRDVVLGLEYLHYQGIIHRDIKPANLLWTEDRQSVKITDFGVAHFSYAQRLGTSQNEDDPEEMILLDESTLSRTAGTPTFLAPEVVYGIGDAVGEDDADNDASRNVFEAAASTRSPPISSPTSGTSLSTNENSERPLITKAIDVWALGVTLYCLLFGMPPWQASTEFQLYGKLRHFDFEVPPTMGLDRIETGGRHHESNDTTEGGVIINLLAGLLEKDYKKRITLDEVKRLPWILRDIPDPEKWLRETSPSRHDMVSVSADETSVAMSQLRFRYPGFANRLIRIFRPKKRQNNLEVQKSPESSAGTRRSKSVNAGGEQKRNSSRSKVLTKGKEKEKTTRLQERSGLLWATYANSGDKVVPLDNFGCLPGRLSRKNSSMQPHLQRQASQQSQTEKSLRDRHHSGGSFYRNFIPLWRGSAGRSTSGIRGPTQVAGQNHARYSEEQINQNEKENGEASVVPRSSSWEPSTDYEGKKQIDILGSESGSEYGAALGDEQMMLGAGGILSRVGSRNSAESGLVLVSPTSGRQLARHPSQSDRLMCATDPPVMADPAMHESRQSRSHTISPLAQELEQVSIFDSDDYDYEDDRVYGLGSQTLIEDDDESSEGEPQHIEIRRRRPSESMTRSSLHRPSEENGHPIGNIIQEL